jgi:hypothetical protein
MAPARGRPPEAVAAVLRFAYSYSDGGSAWDAFQEEWRRDAAVSPAHLVGTSWGAFDCLKAAIQDQASIP